MDSWTSFVFIELWSGLVNLFSDKRLGVEILELSQNLRFKYKTFRFQHIKTIDQRTRIFKTPSVNRGAHILSGQI